MATGKQVAIPRKKARGETGNTPEERIADFRAKIAQRKADTGKDYLSFYYVEAQSYAIRVKVRLSASYAAGYTGTCRSCLQA